MPGAFGIIWRVRALLYACASSCAEQTKKKKKKKKKINKKKTFCKQCSRRVQLTWRFFFHFARITRVLSKQKNTSVSTQSNANAQTEKKKKKKKKKKSKFFSAAR
jgi:hypothetical protein